MLFKTDNATAPSPDDGAVFSTHGDQLTFRSIPTVRPLMVGDAATMPRRHFRTAADRWGGADPTTFENWVLANNATALSPLRNPSWSGQVGALFFRVQMMRLRGALGVEGVLLDGGASSITGLIASIERLSNGSVIVRGTINPPETSTTLAVFVSGKRPPTRQVDNRNTRFLGVTSLSPGTEPIDWLVSGFPRWPVAEGDPVDARLTTVSAVNRSFVGQTQRLTIQPPT